jgi:hypothetical protein
LPNLNNEKKKLFGSKDRRGNCGGVVLLRLVWYCWASNHYSNSRPKIIIHSFYMIGLIGDNIFYHYISRDKNNFLSEYLSLKSRDFWSPSWEKTEKHIDDLTKGSKLFAKVKNIKIIIIKA